MSIYSLRQKLRKSKLNLANLDWIKEQANKKPILPAPKIDPLDTLSADEPTGEVLEDVSQTGKPRKWKEHKQNNLRLAELYKEANKQFPRLISSARLWDMEQCANSLEFLRYADGSKKLKQAYFCRNRLCPMCQWRRSLKLFGQVSMVSDLLAVQYSGIRFLVCNVYSTKLFRGGFKNGNLIKSMPRSKSSRIKPKTERRRAVYKNLCSGI